VSGIFGPNCSASRWLANWKNASALAVSSPKKQWQ